MSVLIAKNVLQARWPAPANVRTLITQRNSRVDSVIVEAVQEEGLYGFNIAQHVDDDPNAVSKRRQALKDVFDLPAEPFWLTQTHSPLALEAKKDSAVPSPEADASYTFQKGVISVVSTADCLPVLLCDKKGSFVAAIHAGWQGLFKGVLQNTLEQVQKKQAVTSEELLVYFGPCISQEHYQVDAEFKQRFIELNPAFDLAFVDDVAENEVSAEGRKYRASLRELATVILQEQGIFNIYSDDFCTFRDDQQFYSYRRSGQTGRFASMIWLQP